MILKLASEYHEFAAAVAAEPAAHEYLALTPDDTVFVEETTRLRNIESMIMDDVAMVRSRIDHELAKDRIGRIRRPMLIIGRESDELQGIFRLCFELLQEAGKKVEWVSYDHPMHGFIFPIRGAGGAYDVDETQTAAIDRIIAYLDDHLRSTP
jgi:hypothetical protein